ncbi:hypothetical protein LTR05_004091 [Lithohypha guttulata]|uniref:Uncharacterized protein n=1 Tax=Lithohypha guttulata TaxID=1690604 RepID=A0AAN7Y7H5_9EURO|nr:hypothetical protein LTR05_004091 [Lithohypha guttulata]
MDDWQDAALTTRHMHNRRGGQGTSGKQKNAIFDVRRTFGTYEIKCPAAEKIIAKAGNSGSSAKLEIYGLNAGGDAVHAELFLPGALHAVVILAASRKTMNAVIRRLEDAYTTKERVDSADDHVAADEEEPEGEAHGEEQPETEDEDDLQNRRVQQFEKNSFRSPKFWLRWQGQVTDQPRSQEDDQEVNSNTTDTDTGYLVFSGNSCDKFEGTISCETLDWRNVKLRGWKLTSKSERDFAMAWHPIIKET